MSKKPTILFVHFGASSFVKEDIRILEKISFVKVFHFKSSSSAFILFRNFIKQLIWLAKNISSADLIYCWFSDYHSFLPTLFSKWFQTPSITILGGYDCNKITSLNYGIFCSSWRAPLGKYVLNNSTLLLPVDKTLIKTDPIAKHWGEAHPNGVTHNVTDFDNNWEALPTGYDPEFWDLGPLDRPKTVCTVALCSNHRTALIKGWDLFIETSKLLPEFEFTIVGAEPSFVPELKKRYKPKDNLTFIAPVPREQLQHIYHQSSVYMQLSRAEGLPNVLCEAMMCGCIPIGSPVFGIPNVIWQESLIAKTPIPIKIADLVNLAHLNNDKLRPKAREHIIEQFHLIQRNQRLDDVIMHHIHL